MLKAARRPLLGGSRSITIDMQAYINANKLRTKENQCFIFTQKTYVLSFAFSKGLASGF